MERTFITNIRQLCGIVAAETCAVRGADAAHAFGVLEDAWLELDTAAGTIAGFGTMADLAAGKADIPVEATTIDARGGVVIPAFADAHTELLTPGREFAGAHSDEDLFRLGLQRLSAIGAKGTAAVEIKCPAATAPDMLRLLHVVARLKENSPLEIRATALPRAAAPEDYADGFADRVASDMLPALAAERLADFVDFECDAEAFTAEQTDALLTAARDCGLAAKTQADMRDGSGGVQTAIGRRAIAIAGLERTGGDEITLLGRSAAIATMLPAASFYRGVPFAPARMAVRAGAAVALASGFEPDTAPSADMRFVWALGCIKMRLSAAEALAACTINAAAAMGLGSRMGAISPGRDASIILSRPLPDAAFIPHAYTAPWISQVFLRSYPLLPS